MSSAYSGPIAAAAAAWRKQQQEEDDMTLMNTDPSGAVEYKIIRSVTGVFKDFATLRAVLREEAQAGWDLVEKLDNHRLRLQRSIECRKADAGLAQDPYRTRVGISEGALVFAIFIVFAVLAGALVGILTLRH